MTRHLRDTPWRLLAIGAVRVRYRRRTVLLGAILLIGLIAVGLLAVLLGDPLISPVDLVTGALTRGQAYVVRQLRIPRVLSGLIAGFAFGLGGSLFQNLTRNPLGSPDVLGIIAGASTGAIVALTVWDAPTQVVALSALAGGLAVAVPLALLATLGRQGLGTVILVGMGTALLLNAVNSWLLLRATPEVGYQAGRWLIGTLEFASWYQVPRAGLTLLIVATLFVVNIRALPLLGFTDRQNAAVGANPVLVNTSFIVFGIALVALGVWTTGPLTLLAFFAPQVAQRLSRAHAPPFYLSGLVGSLTLVSADLLGRVVLAEASVAVGSTVLVLGGAYLLWMLLWRPRDLIR